MTYKLAPHVTPEMLKDEYFREEKDCFTRGGTMGWAHKVDKTTRIIDYCDVEYAKKYEGKVGGLKVFIQDLISEGYVIANE